MFCTSCEEEWEEEFFCDDCSKVEYDGIDFYSVAGYHRHTICLNCCNCAVAGIGASNTAHNKAFAGDATSSTFIGDDIPF